MPLPVGEDGKAISFPKEHEFEEEYSIQYPSYVNREYVWDPDQTDRILAQVDGAHFYSFIPTDESWTPVGVVEGGAAVAPSTAGRVLSQFSFDPMGTLLNREDLLSSASFNRLDIGHQGLFYEPYEDEMAQSGTEDRLFPSRPGLYFNRARWYDPELGRFTTSDPNASGVPVVGSVSGHGRQRFSGQLSLSVLALYGDGMNTFGRVGNNPVRWADPEGLEFTALGLGRSMAIGAGIGGVSNGVVGGLYKGQRGWDLAWTTTKGAIAGAVGGFLGYSFSAAAAWATFGSYGQILVGSTAGGAGSGATTGLLSGRSASEIGEDAMWGGGMGLFTGLMGSAMFSQSQARLPLLERYFEGLDLDGLFAEVFEGYFSAAAAGFTSMADELRHP